MARPYRNVIVGAGHMGLAIIQGLLRSVGSAEVIIVERNAKRRAQLETQYALASTADLRPRDGDMVVLAIQPQNFPEFAEVEADKFTADVAVVSVMAGIRIATIATALRTNQVVRTIPNTPAEVSRGMTVYYAPPAVSAGTLERTEKILAAIGAALRARDESMIDAATAICGGGPAFVSYFADAFCAFAETENFSREDAIRMTAEVLSGTADLIAVSGRPPDTLCREVMTPNGTTERGIARFDASRLKQIVIEALGAATARSRELSGQPASAPATLRSS